MRKLTAYCSRDVRVADISGKADLSAQRSVCSGGLVVLWHRVEEDPVIKSLADVVFEQADLNGEAWCGRGDAVPRARPPQRPEPGPALDPWDAGCRRSRPALLFWLRGGPEELVVVRTHKQRETDNYQFSWFTYFRQLLMWIIWIIRQIDHCPVQRSPTSLASLFFFPFIHFWENECSKLRQNL